MLRLRAAGMARMLAVLAEFDRREGWAVWQCRSAQEWLSWKYGLGYGGVGAVAGGAVFAVVTQDFGGVFGGVVVVVEGALVALRRI